MPYKMVQRTNRIVSSRPSLYEKMSALSKVVRTVDNDFPEFIEWVETLHLHLGLGHGMNLPGSIQLDGPYFTGDLFGG